MEVNLKQFYANSKSIERFLNCLTIRIAKLSNQSVSLTGVQYFLSIGNVIDLYAIKAKSIAVSECIGANQSFDNEMLSSFGPIPTDFLPISICSRSIDVRE